MLGLTHIIISLVSWSGLVIIISDGDGSKSNKGDSDEELREIK